MYGCAGGPSSFDFLSFTRLRQTKSLPELILCQILRHPEQTTYWPRSVGHLPPDYTWDVLKKEKKKKKIFFGNLDAAAARRFKWSLDRSASAPLCRLSSGVPAVMVS